VKTTVNKNLSSAGSNVIVTDIIMKGVIKITGYDENIDGLSNISRIYREFSVSYDSKEFSTWYPLTDVNLSAYINTDNPKDGFILKVKFTVTEKYDTNPIVIKDFEIKTITDGSEIEDIECNIEHAIEIDMGIIPDYKELGISTAKLNNTMNNYFNRASPFDVLYFRTEPDIDSVDPFLNEYSLYNTVNKGGTCIKVIVTDNKVPDPKHEYSEWGLDFDAFEIEINKDYFEEMFGKNMKPRNEDYMFFPTVNRMYYVHSNNLGRGINETATNYTLSLKKYDENTSVIKDGEALEFLKEHTISHEEIFIEQLTEEKIDMVNDQQNSLKTIADDVVRELVNEKMKIIDNPIYNNGTTLMKSFYNMCKVPFNEVAVKYKPSHKLLSGGSWSHISWINIPSEEDNLRTLNLISAERINFNTIKVVSDKVLSQLALKEYDSITRFGKTYDIESIIDDTTFTLNSRTDILSTEMDLFKKSVKNNLHTTVIGSSVFQINLYDRNKIQIRHGNTLWYLGGFTLSEDTWYNITINISDSHGYIGAYIWGLEERNITDSDPNSTRLTLIHKIEIPLVKGCIIIPEGSIACVAGSKIHMGNIRILKKAIDIEYQSYFSGNRTIKKASVAYIVDDSEVIFNLGVMGRGNTYLTERMETREKTSLGKDDRI
jgi:hypothetical protein